MQNKKKEVSIFVDLDMFLGLQHNMEHTYPRFDAMFSEDRSPLDPLCLPAGVIPNTTLLTVDGTLQITSFWAQLGEKCKLQL
jgi:hypothetical protein